jgi:ABC-type lipoprotein export system ATPase subunit
MSRSSPILALHGVSKSFPGSDGSEDVVVLDHVGLTIGAGEKMSLVGPSGSGKSTLLSLVAGLLRPDTGTVLVDGVDLGGLGDRERARVRADRIGIALQSDNLIPFLSARENIELALGFAHRTSRSVARARALELLDRFGVVHRADHRPRHLSGGEAQRVALAVAMANEPALLLADEVVAQLDGETAGLVVDEVLAGEFAVLYVTHDIALADRVERRYELREHRIEPR